LDRKVIEEENHMSFTTVLPDAIQAAAGSLQTIGSAMGSATAAAAPATTGVVPCAADPVSALTATAFSTHATLHHEIAAQAQAIHELFVNNLNLNSATYLAAEVANAATAG
jgi:PE family